MRRLVSYVRTRCHGTKGHTGKIKKHHREGHPIEVAQKLKHFYRAMHLVQSVVLLICYRVSRPSIYLSVCLSVALVYRGRTGWSSSKVITQVVALRSHNVCNLVQGKHPQNSGGIGWGVVFSRKLIVSLKQGKIGPRLLLMTNRKSHIRVFDWCQNQ